MEEGSAVLLITAGYDHTIRFWEALSGVCYKTLQHTESQINALSISPDKKLVVAAGNPQLRVFDIAGGTASPVQVLEGHSGNVTSVGFQKDGRWLYSGSEDGTVKIWDLRTAKYQRDYEHQAPVNDVTLHPNQGELVSCAQNGSIKIWDLTGDACTHELVPEEDVAVRSVSISSDGTMLVAANSQGHCFVWKITGGTASNAFDDISMEQQPAATTTAASKSSSSSPSDDPTVEETPTELHPITRLQAHSTYITRCLFSPDGRRLATASADHTIKIWDTGTFLLDKTLVGHQRWVWDCVFSADSAYMISASSDQVARLWDLSTGETIRHYTGHNKPIVCVALHDLP